MALCLLASVKPYQGLWFVFPLLKCFVLSFSQPRSLKFRLMPGFCVEGKHLKVLTLIGSPSQPAKPDNHTLYFCAFFCLKPPSDESAKPPPPPQSMFTSRLPFETQSAFHLSSNHFTQTVSKCVNHEMISGFSFSK